MRNYNATMPLLRFAGTLCIIGYAMFLRQWLDDVFQYVSAFSTASSLYELPFFRLHSLHKHWQFSLTVRPPLLQGLMWSASISSIL